MFERFLLGDSLEECYDAVAEVANRWLDMLDTQASMITLSLSATNPDDSLHVQCIVLTLAHCSNMQII